MSNIEKLNALFDIAYKNGLKGTRPVYDENMGQWYVSDQDGGYIVSSIFELIFSCDFARALFGEGPSCAYCKLPPHSMHPNPCPEGSNIWPYLWEYHLQQAIVLPSLSEQIGYLYNAAISGQNKEKMS